MASASKANCPIRARRSCGEASATSAMIAMNRAIRSASGAMAERMARFMAIMAEVADASPQERRARIGQFALEADAMAEEEFVALFSYLKGEPWPRRFSCTAV